MENYFYLIVFYFILGVIFSLISIFVINICVIFKKKQYSYKNVSDVKSFDFSNRDLPENTQLSSAVDAKSANNEYLK